MIDLDALERAALERVNDFIVRSAGQHKRQLRLVAERLRAELATPAERWIHGRQWTPEEIATMARLIRGDVPKESPWYAGLGGAALGGYMLVDPLPDSFVEYHGSTPLGLARLPGAL